MTRLTVNPYDRVARQTSPTLGVSYLPYLCLRALIERGALEVVETTPSLPKISYVALYRGERKSGFISSILRLAQECCDFSDLFQIDETIASK